MVYERARHWLEEKNINTREEAEKYLSNLGEDINSLVWSSVLDAIYPEAEINTINVEALNAISQQQKEELQQKPEELNFFDRAGRFIRRILRGEI